MKSIPGPTLLGAVLVWAALAGGCAAPHGNPQSVVRQKFVPVTHATEPQSPRGRASWTALVPLTDGTGVARLIAHAGVGESFPVKEMNGPCLFEVFVVGGDDDRLEIEVRSVDAAQRIELVRDKSVQAQIGLVKYDFAYPSITVAAASNQQPTTGQAMLLIHRRP